METNGFPNDEQHDEFDLAQYDDDFAAADVEGDVVDDGAGLVLLAQVADFKQAHRRGVLSGLYE